MLRVGLLLLALAFQNQPKPLPELQSFLTELRESLHSNDSLLSNYTYTEKNTYIDLDSNNKPKKTTVNVFQVFPGSCERPEYRRQILKNGVPVSEKELAKNDKLHQLGLEPGGWDR